MSKCYLVTGCAGFIASKVVDLLLEAGHWVVGVDNLNDAYDPRLKRWRLAQFDVRERFRFHRADITDRAAMESLFETGGGWPVAETFEESPFSAVIHLAARAGVRASVDEPGAFFETNCTGTLNLLELCRRHEVRKFVLASSSSLYGGHNEVPFREKADTDRPLSPYAASKKAAETLAYAYHHLHGLDVSIPRYFTVYGPAGRPDMSVFRFIRRIAEREPIEVFGDGSQSRDFTYVDDIARGTVAALAPMGYEIINLGGDCPTRLTVLIDEIARLLGRRPEIIHRPPQAVEVPATWADVGKAKRLLNWTAEVPVEEGLRRSVDWYLTNRQMALTVELGQA